MQHGGESALVSAEIDCFVDLDPAQKGVHMSRFPELFGEAIDELVIGETLLVERLAEHIARHIVERQDACRAEVSIRARYPMERLTPVTGLRTQELVTLIGIAAATPDATRRVVGAEATGINACPCAQGMVRSERPSGSATPGSTRSTWSGSSSSSRWRRTTSGAAARSTSARSSGSTHRISSGIIERSMSSPIYELLKRPDELFVVEHAHLAPRFVEDSVRLSVQSALEEVEALADDDFVLARQINFETIHNHEVLAERFGTVGELRRELETGEHSARHTELRDWLSAA